MVLLKQVAGSFKKEFYVKAEESIGLSSPSDSVGDQYPDKVYINGEACSTMNGMKWIKPVFLLLIMNLLFASNVYANENIFELIAPSSYKPANLLKEFELIDSGNYRLNLNQNINSLFPDHELTDATLYLVIPSTCTVTDISTDYKVHRRTDFNYYIFKPAADEKNMHIDVSVGLKTVTISSMNFGFIVVARDSAGETLVHNKHDNIIHKEIIMREYLSGLPKDPDQ